MGIGDLMVGKHVGRMMGALGGRLSAFRGALAGEDDMAGAIRRNMFRDEAAPDAAVAAVETRLRALATRIDGTALADLLAGRLA
jgi:cytochrome b pre-mRNA-processing protein 3